MNPFEQLRDVQFLRRKLVLLSDKLHTTLIALAASNVMRDSYHVSQPDDGARYVVAKAGSAVPLTIDPVSIWRTVYELDGQEPNSRSHPQFGLMAMRLPSFVEPSNARSAG